jgi:LPXTG-motif cell wall-anchored protein
VAVSSTDNSVGGLLGFNDGGSVSNSHATGSVTSATGDRVGGLVGFSDDNGVPGGGAISASSATGAVTGAEGVGGLVGSLDGPLSASLSSGAVNGVKSVGGLVGFVNNSRGTILNSYSTGTATARTSSGFYTVGGLVGFLSQDVPVTNSWSSGSVVGDDPGGLIAFSDTPTTANSSFWDTQTSGQASSPGGGTAKTTAQMKLFSTFETATWKIVSGWQIYDASTRVWGLCSGVNSGYPFLLWEYSTNPCGSPPSSSSAAPTTSTTPTTLAATGAEVEWLALGSLIAVVAGAGFFALGRRKRA